ncbi:MAG TPA: YdcF family protein [Bryobacteraceae bacterium]|nr:YdcF family protein [Bryobacteraceae bacterium]
MTAHDAILVLGGGVREGGELPIWVKNRFDLALRLHRGEPIVCLSAGTPHRPPPLDEFGFPIFESAAGARYLMSKGLAPELIQIENVSYDTIGNAYFSKLVHVDPPGWSKLLVITSEFHMERTRAIFEWVYGMGQAAYQMEFAASPDGIEPAVAAMRRGHEAKGLERQHALMDRLKTSAELHAWIFSEHAAYKPDRRFVADQTADPAVLASY